MFPIEFDLPARLIAQEPCAQRDQARLLVLRRRDGSLTHHRFSELPDLLCANDLLVLNDTRVLPARLLGRRRTGGKWEGLFVKSLADGTWEMLCRGKLREGERITVEGPNETKMEIRLLARLGDGRWQTAPDDQRQAPQVLEAFGHVPLPPYIRKGHDQPADRERYQTVFARHAGAVAAPTAGLHFTPELLDRLHAQGIAHGEVTLHVGLGTFQPIEVDDFTRHAMHYEWGELPQATVAAIELCRARQGKVVAVGTTAVRVLETAAKVCMPIKPWSGETNLFIYPPYQFALTDALVTNFHLPRSTLLLLAAAFAGAPLLHKAYETAIAAEYRFFSYGDAMLIL